MKGVFVHNQVEYRLEVSGEEFQQGAALPCVVSVTNHSAAALTLPGIRLERALGDMKKVKEKAAGALQILEAADPGPAVTLPPQGKGTLAWTFQTAINCPITDKSRSLHILFGSTDDSVPPGTALVTVVPHNHIAQVVSLLESSFQFVFKGYKSADDCVQAKLKSPSTRRLSLLEELNLCCRFVGEALELKYKFKVKAFSATASSVSVTKEKSEVTQLLQRSQYLLTDSHINHEAIERSIEEALSTVSTGI